MARLAILTSVLGLLASFVAAAPYFGEPYPVTNLYEPNPLAYQTVSRRSGKCSDGVPHYLRVVMAYDPILCLTTGGEQKTKAYLKKSFETARMIFARDTCVRLELVDVVGFCDPFSGAFRKLLTGGLFREEVPYGVSHFGLPKLPGLPSLDPNALAKALDPRQVTDAFKTMFETAFHPETDLVIAVSGIPFDSLNLALTIPGCACMPPVHYGYVFGTGEMSITHEIGHTLGALHSLLPGIMTIQNFGIMPKKFTPDSVRMMQTYLDMTGCLETKPHCCARQSCEVCTS